MPVFALLIISKAGSLIYHRTFPTASPSNNPMIPSTGTLGLPGTTSLTTNDYLVLAGTFHGVHAITKSLTPKIPFYPDPPIPNIRDSVSSGRDTITGTTTGSNTPRKDARGNWTNGGSTPQGLGSQTPKRSYRAPNPELANTGIETLETAFFRLTVHQTLTGTKFLLFTDPSFVNAEGVVKGVHGVYADFVCKNPFWGLEQPVRIEAWEREVMRFLFRR